MTLEKLKDAQELSDRIERLERLVRNSSTMLYIVGTGESKDDLVCMSDFDGCGDAHKLIVSALKGLLEKLKAEFEQI